MRRILSLGVMVTLLGSTSPGWSQENSDGILINTVDEVIHVYERPFQVSLSPGLLSYPTFQGENESRLSTSLLLTRNFSSASPARSPIQYGGRLGLIYTHLGAPDSGFFGTGGNLQGANGNLFIVPLHVWVGYYWEGSRLLTSIHTGSDLYLATNESSLDMGRDGKTHFFPALGFQIGWDTGKNFSLSFHNNWTLAPSDGIYSGMLGVTLPLS